MNAEHRTSRPKAVAYTLLVDAEKDRAVAFYRHHGFRSFASQPQTLFLPLATAQKALLEKIALEKKSASLTASTRPSHSCRRRSSDRFATLSARAPILPAERRRAESPPPASEPRDRLVSSRTGRIRRVSKRRKPPAYRSRVPLPLAARPRAEPSRPHLRVARPAPSGCRSRPCGARLYRTWCRKDRRRRLTSARIPKAVHNLANVISWLIDWSICAACVWTLVTGRERVRLVNNLADRVHVCQRVARRAQRIKHLVQRVGGRLQMIRDVDDRRHALASTRQSAHPSRRRRFPDPAGA